jgi:hypothetical protein
MVTYGAELQLTQELVRKIPNPTAAVAALEQRVENLEAQQTKTIATIEKSARQLETISHRLLLPAASIDQLGQQLRQHTQLFEKPLKKSVHYTHFIGRSILVCTILSLVILGLTFLSVHLWMRSNKYAENDIKWRHAKLSANSEVLRSLFETDNAYRTDPEGLKAAVIAEEERRKQLVDKALQLQQTQDEMHELEQQGKKP